MQSAVLSFLCFFNSAGQCYYIKSEHTGVISEFFQQVTGQCDMIIISEHNQSPFRGLFSLPGSQAVHIPDEKMERR
jgi:hypothetical protein